MRIALIASGGGHVRQLLDIQSFWAEKDYFFVTEDTPLTRDIKKRHKTYFVPHFALGQARLGEGSKMILAAIASFWVSASIILRERPGIVITTGAGSCFPPVLIARMIGAKIVLIDSFARFKGPSAFARIATRLAHVLIAQSEQSARNWPGSSVIDPFRDLGPYSGIKEDLVFATVGATLPFDRLVTLVSAARRDGILSEHVLLQRGNGSTASVDPSIEVRDTMTFEEVRATLRRASIVICHAGTGSIITALQEGCRVVAIPRLFERREHYDNHQWEIAESFAARELVTMVGDDDDLPTALAIARRRKPVRATLDQSDLVRQLDALFERWIDRRSSKIGVQN